SLLLLRPPLRSPLFPYTTLFRSWAGVEGDQRRPIIPSLFFQYVRSDGGRSRRTDVNPSVDFRVSTQFRASLGLSYSHDVNDWQRSEEHTSELQSRFDLVCRLLLE